MIVMPGDDNAQVRRLVVRTKDFDEAHRAMERVFLPMAMWPMEHLTALDMRLDSTRVGDMMTSAVRFGRYIGLRSVEAATFHVAAPVSGVAESRVGSHEPIETTPESAAIFGVGEPIDIRWPGDCAQMCLDFPRVALELRLEQHLDRALNRPLTFEPEMDLTTPKGRSWLRMLRLANREARRPHGLLDHPLAAKSVEAALLDGLLLAQPHNYSDALYDTRVAPPRAVRDAIELLEAYPDRPWSAPALANEVHASVRALQEGFRRSLDTTPMRYLRDVRLRRVRGALLAATPDVTTVGSIVYRWGILNQGRFAGEYRRKFDETPSETLRKPATTTAS
jgi:AraC-like DNA-binding protein